MCALAINGFFMDGAKEGLSFYLLPNIENIKEAGLVNIIVAAMNQSFFTLSLGIGAMATFGSYLGKERSLLGESITIALLDTFVAITSGLIIFPAVFSAGIEPTSGPPLIFETLPTIFADLSMGRLLGALFFLFMSFAALSTVITVFEGINSSVLELTGWSRKKTSVINFILVFVISLPSAFANNILSNFHPFGEGSNFQDIPSELVDKVFLPLGSLTFILFCTTKYGWGWDRFVEEVNSGKGAKLPKWMKPYFKYVLPIIVIVLFLVGIYNFVTNL